MAITDTVFKSDINQCAEQQAFSIVQPDLNRPTSVWDIFTGTYGDLPRLMYGNIPGHLQLHINLTVCDRMTYCLTDFLSSIE